LIDSFLKDLHGIASLFAGGEKTRKTRTLAYVSGAGAATFSWTADEDYYYLAAHSSSGAEVQVTTSGKALIALGTKADFTQGDVLHITTTTTSTTVPIQHTFIPKGTVLTVVIGAASSTCNILLEYA
jgi:hypothetical protein